jgi:acyl carrier protein phosphodiesterase
MEKALEGLSRRASFHSTLHEAIGDLKADYERFEEDFLLFFPELLLSSKEFLANN